MKSYPLDGKGIPLFLLFEVRMSILCLSHHCILEAHNLHREEFHPRMDHLKVSAFPNLVNLRCDKGFEELMLEWAKTSGNETNIFHMENI